jgi:hypothetical protein
LYGDADSLSDQATGVKDILIAIEGGTVENYMYGDAAPSYAGNWVMTE